MRSFYERSLSSEHAAATIVTSSCCILCGVEAPNVDFNLSRLERVIAGPGKVATLGQELERRNLQRAILVTGKTLGASPLLKRVTDALGERCAVVFRQVGQHVPRNSVQKLQGEIERVRADCVISFGGGSPIDACKAACYAFLPARDVVHIAVPTTLSAGEYTYTAGITDEESRVKSGIADPRLQPRTVLNDPLLAIETPAWLWLATGVRALDHAVECIYAIRHHPISDTLGTRAISLLVEHLPLSTAGSRDEQVAHRGYCQMAAWFSIFGGANTRFNLSHLLGRQIGPRWNIPHGVTSCITLPHVMRFMAGIAPERFGPIAEGFGIPFERENPKPGALACADRTAQFIEQLEVPHTLKDAGVPHEEIGQIVETVAQGLDRAEVVDRPVTQQEILAVLEAAY